MTHLDTNRWEYSGALNLLRQLEGSAEIGAIFRERNSPSVKIEHAANYVVFAEGFAIAVKLLAIRFLACASESETEFVGAEVKRGLQTIKVRRILG